MWRFLHDTWWRLTTTPPASFTDRFLSGFLQGGAWLYGAAVSLRNTAYDRGWLRQERLPCPVISVGNLSVGGTGKTTCVEYLAHRLAREDRRVCILSRGYGSRRGHPHWLLYRQGQLLLNGETAVSGDGPTTCRRPSSLRRRRRSASGGCGRWWDGLPDEPELLASHLPDVPVLVGARREETGRQACEEFHANALLLDDGFQYRRLARDCEIVLVSARMPLGGWPLFPRGPMREPLRSLARADVILITKADQLLDRLAALQERLKALNPAALIATAVHEPEVLRDWRTDEPVALERLANSRVGLLSSIGDPEGFEQTVQRLGASVVAHLAYPDHHRYEAAALTDALHAASASGAVALVTTEKDFMRLKQFRDTSEALPIPLWVLSVQMRLLSGEQELDDRLAGVCAR